MQKSEKKINQQMMIGEDIKKNSFSRFLVSKVHVNPIGIFEPQINPQFSSLLAVQAVKM